MSEKKRVLIICRSSAGQMYLGVLLSRIWFSSILARTPDEGIRLARKSPFSLTLFDGELLEPELQTAITLLRTDPVLKDQPLVVFMTNDDPVKIQALLSQGCAAVLTKPLDLALMYGVLVAALRTAEDHSAYRGQDARGNCGRHVEKGADKCESVGRRIISSYPSAAAGRRTSSYPVHAPP